MIEIKKILDKHSKLISETKILDQKSIDDAIKEIIERVIDECAKEATMMIMDYNDEKCFDIDGDPIFIDVGKNHSGCEERYQVNEDSILQVKNKIKY